MDSETGRILIVEDDPDLAENLVEILEDLGFKAESVPSAEAALERVASTRFDGVITDFRLPGLTGVELIRRLRDKGASLPIVVVSAFIDSGTAETAERAGALDVLSKPVDLNRLFRLVQTFVERSDRVLIVDDNEALAENVAEALKAEGLLPDVRSDGCSALSDRSLPRIALVDLRLPDLDGVEVARRLYSRDPSIKILFITAHGDDFQQELASGKGNLPFVDQSRPYVSKPFDLGELVAKVKGIAERR